MKVLFVGGTGVISTAVSRLAVERGIELYLLNRGLSGVEIPGAHMLKGDIYKPEQVHTLLKGHHFDSVVNWVNFTVPEIERDIALFEGKTDQYVFISSASAYQKPPTTPFITESTPLHNPYWEYSQNKILCEQRLMREYNENLFPVTIVRPSHTYDTIIPVAIGGGHTYTVVDRMLQGQPVIVHGDGSSLWVLTRSEDFAKGVVGLLGHPRTIGQAFQITSDEVLTWDQIYLTLAAAVGVEPVLVHVPSELIASIVPDQGPGLLGDKAHSVIFDNSKIKSYVPDYVATIPYHIGIRRTLAWFQAKPERCVPDPLVNLEIEKILTAYNRAWA